MLFRSIILLTFGVVVTSTVSQPLRAQGAKGPDVILGIPSEVVIVERWSAMVRAAAEAGEFSGVALLAKDGVPLYLEAFGFANRALAVKNTSDTRFNLGSEGKMFTAVAIAQLAEKGKLSFQDSVIKYIPDYQNREAAKRVTIHHLLTHTSGLGFYPFRHGEPDLESLMRSIASDPLAFEPGSEFQYSNAGYLVLGVVIERITGMPYLDYVTKHILEPAGMWDTGDLVARINDPSIAIAYRIDDKSGRRVSAVPLLEPFASPAGGSYSTAGDMLRLGEALRKHVLLGSEMTETLFEGRVEMGPPGLKYAYGFGEHVVNGHRSVGHNGGAPGVAADFRIYLDDGYTTVLFSNFGGREVMALARAVEEMVTAQ